MLGFFNTETLSREDVIYAVTRGALLHQPLKQGSSNPHSCPSAKMFRPKKCLFCSSLGFPVGKLSLSLPLQRDAQKRSRKSWWKGESFTMVWTRAWPQLPQESSLQGTDTAPLLLEGNTGFEERIKEALVLALYLEELISQKYFLGAHVNQSLCHVLCEGHGKSQAPGESWAQLGRAVNPSRSKQGGQKAVGMLPVGRGGHNAQGKGPEPLCFHNWWAEATPEGGSAPPYLPQTQMDPLRKELRAARGDHRNPARGIFTFEAKGTRRHFEMVWVEGTLKTVMSPAPLSQAVHLPFWTPCLYLQRVLIGNHNLIYPKQEPDLNQRDFNHWF